MLYLIKFVGATVNLAVRYQSKGKAHFSDLEIINEESATSASAIKKTMAEMIRKAEKMVSKAAELRARAAQLENDAATLSKDAASQGSLCRADMSEATVNEEHDVDNLVTALSNVLIVDPDNEGESKPRSKLLDLYSNVPLMRDQVKQARKTLRLLERTKSSAVVGQAKKVLNRAKGAAAREIGSKDSKESTVWAADVIAWADARKQRLQEADAILAHAKKQYKNGIRLALSSVKKQAHRPKLQGDLKPIMSEEFKGGRHKRKHRRKRASKAKSKSKKTIRQVPPKLMPVDQSTCNSGRFSRQPIAEFERAHNLPVGQIPVMSGAVITNQLVDNSHRFGIPIYLLLAARDEHAPQTQHHQFAASDDARIDGMLSDDRLPQYGSDDNRASSKHDGENLVPGYIKREHTFLSMSGYMPMARSDYHVSHDVSHIKAS